MIEKTDMKFYIVTPTYNSLDWLKRAIRSVADQVGEGVEVHHHVQDGGSKDGTPQWLEEWQRNHQDISGYIFTYESCPDKGMYDALNHAWDKMPEDADITAHLNSDEQYLPNALAQVGVMIEKRGSIDMLISTFIVLKEDSSYHCHYRPVRPNAWKCRAVSMIRTSACFLKASTFRRVHVRFDVGYKIIADRLFYADYLKHGISVVVAPGLVTTTDAMTGTNLAWSENLVKEENEYSKTLPLFLLFIRGAIWRTNNLLRRVVDKFYSPPRQYAIYVSDNEKRNIYSIDNPTCRWKLK